MYLQSEIPRLPKYYLEIDRHHAIKVKKNGVVNGQPYPYPFTRAKIDFTTRIMVAQDASCMMPMIRIRKKGKGDIEACMEMYFDYKTERSKGMRGRDLEGEHPESANK